MSDSGERELERQLDEVRLRITELDKHYPTKEAAAKAYKKLSDREDEILAELERLNEQYGTE
jgi:hypothetical protein